MEKEILNMFNVQPARDHKEDKQKIEEWRLAYPEKKVVFMHLKILIDFYDAFLLRQDGSFNTSLEQLKKMEMFVKDYKFEFKTFLGVSPRPIEFCMDDPPNENIRLVNKQTATYLYGICFALALHSHVFVDCKTMLFEHYERLAAFSTQLYSRRPSDA